MRGSVYVVERARGPVFYGKWRDARGRQVKRLLGPAWVGQRGRTPDGLFDHRGAIVALAAAVKEYEASQAEPRVDRAATFADAAATWLLHLEHVDGAKPSTLTDYRYLLAPTSAQARHRGRQPSARIMRAFGHRALASITTADVHGFLRGLDVDAGITPRTVNKNRQLLCSVFKHAMRDDTFRLPLNPAAATDKRREPDARPIDFYEPDEVQALARAAESGDHRDPTRPAVSEWEIADRALADQQDAAIYLVAAFAGLRMGELLALCWRHVDFVNAKLLVEASWTGGRLTTPKSRKWRAVPLADQPAGALARLADRQNFVARDDLVFCSPAGDYLDPSALRRRYKRTQEAAGLRPLRFHDLRHSFGSLVIREFDPVSVKDFMGHSKLATTERYLHARPRRTDAARLTKAFTAEQRELEEAIA